MFSLFVSVCFSRALANDEIIPVWGSSVNPLHNPLETYDYAYIPTCMADGQSGPVRPSFFRRIFGNRLQRTGFVINFLKPVKKETLCEMTIDDEKYELFEKAIHRKFVAQMYIGKLPEMYTIGSLTRDNESTIYTNHRFILSHNNQHVVEVKMITQKPVPLKRGGNITFSYSVDWQTSNKKYRERFDRYCDLSFCNHQVRNYSVMNSFVLSLLMILLVAFIMTRFLTSDIRRFEREAEFDEFELELRSERGWKMVHADVFRVPEEYGALSVLIGAGGQALTAVLLFVLANMTMKLFMRYNSLMVVGFSVYAFSAVVAGYFSGSLFRRWNGRQWIRHGLSTALAIPLGYVGYKVVVNTASYLFGAGKTIHYSAAFTAILIILVVVIPLTFGGTIIGRHWFFLGEDPARVGLIKRVIPRTPVYLRKVFLSLIVGLLGAASIFMEFYYILTAIWQYKLFCVWKPLFLSILLLCVVVSCATIVIIYFRLNEENYEWQWASFLCPFGVTYYLIAYSIYYLNKFVVYESTLQVIYFIASSTALSAIVGVICGFVGFVASTVFIRVIFRNMKTD